MKPLLLLLAALLLGSPTPAPQPAPLRYDLAATEQWCVAAGADRCTTVTLGGSPAPPLAAAPPAPVPRPVTEGVRLVVSLAAQRLYVFDEGDFIASSPVSTGKRGHGTPAGTFRILEKQVHHRSNKYSNAPMPYMQRLTMSGVAIHAGHLPGYPASHGCIRLPPAFARRLYGLTDRRTTVTITRARPKKAREALAFAQAI
jgi:lipoprotein-anchoring transpeptidase ErfK/SrfK